ncbi:MAG TPA: DUF2934 domain-containing protein [Methylobacter sp.]
MAEAKSTKPASKPAVKKPAAKPMAKPAAKPAMKAAAKPAAKKAVVKKPAAKKPAPKKKAASGAEERYRMIEVAAYYIAERNGFGGDPKLFWVEAEMQIKKLLKS